jgi:HTH-type transcriptional regulator / antitoxin HipB
MHYIRCMDYTLAGAMMRAARKASGQSQGALAASLGMSRATVSAIENGTIREIGVRKLDALCGALGLELSLGPKKQRPTLNDLRRENREQKAR